MPERISLVFAPEYCSSSQHILEQYLLENLQRILFALFRHLQEHNDHSIQWQEVSYLEHEEDWKKRQIKEALCINAMDSKETVNLEKFCIFKMAVSEVVSVSRMFERPLMKTPLSC